MPREIICIQVGQCGNQLGCGWWDLLLQEHRANPEHTDALSSMFYESGGGGGGGRGESTSTISNNNNAPQQTSSSSGTRISKVGGPTNRNAPTSSTNFSHLKARCLPIDMEEGVLNAMLRGPLASLFDTQKLISDVSGAGNNWAVGHMEYGDRHIGEIENSVSTLVEQCDSLQSFFLLHSLSGGTGSGLGTRVLSMLEDSFPHIFRFCSVVAPTVSNEDVVIAPYNTCFSLRELIQHADCVIPLDNSALAAVADRAITSSSGGKQTGTTTTTTTSTNPNNQFNAAKPTKNSSKLPFDTMNALAAQMLSNLTCSMRFPGQLNMDLNEITTNLVPYPRLHFLVSSIAPLAVTRHVLTGAKQLDSMFASACLEQNHQLVTCPSRQCTYLASAIIARGKDIGISDITRNVSRVRDKMNMIYWNQDGFKTALCSVPPLGHAQSVLALSNNCGIAQSFAGMRDQFAKLYSVRSHVHHYQEYLELPFFEDTLELISTTVDDYAYLNTVEAPKQGPRSVKDLLLI